MKECDLGIVYWGNYGINTCEVPYGCFFVRVVLVTIPFVQFISVYFIPHTIQDLLIEYTSDIVKIFRGIYTQGGRKKFKYNYRGVCIVAKGA